MDSIQMITLRNILSFYLNLINLGQALLFILNKDASNKVFIQKL